MKNVYKLDRSVAGHSFKWSQTALSIESPTQSFELKRNDDEIVYFVDIASSISEGTVLKCRVSGWSYSRKHGAPVKSMYVGYEGKLIGRGKPLQRIDVRIAENLTFDYCGFECEFTVPRTGQANYPLTLVFVGENNSTTHHLKLVDLEAKQHISNTTPMLDASVIRPSESAFNYRIESAQILGDCIRFVGWCYLKKEPSEEVYISFLRSGVFLSEIRCVNISREDVGQGLSLIDPYHFYGFDITSQPLTGLPTNPSDQSLDMFISAPGQGIKELMNIYSK